MIVAGADGLIRDIAVSFVVPAVCLALALINIRSTPRSKYNPLKLRLFLIFVLFLFASFLSTLMYQDRVVLKALWRDNPVLYSFVYFLSGALVVAGVVGLVYWKLRPELWKGKGREPVS
jgi:glucose-6-phosphate-specific signal transduction histidine kinase